jgi:hypothetical protein
MVVMVPTILLMRITFDETVTVSAVGALVAVIVIVVLFFRIVYTMIVVVGDH